MSSLILSAFSDGIHYTVAEKMVHSFLVRTVLIRIFELSYLFVPLGFLARCHPIDLLVKKSHVKSIFRL